MVLDIDSIREMVVNFVVLYGMRLLVAVVILIIGTWVINRLNRLLQNLMLRKGVDESLRPFLGSIINVALWVLLIVLIVAQLGLEMTSFIAVLGSAGLAIGLALQGSLSNFAGGVLILTIKPFRVGDFIEAQGQMGTVHMINIFNTVIKTGNNQVIYMPNGPLASSVVVNYSVEPTRRMELQLVISPENDLAAVKRLLQDLIDADPRILNDPAPVIAVTAFTEYSLTISMRLWAKKDEFWPLNWEMNERVKTAFKENDIKAPAPVQKREVISVQPTGKA
ncbi:small conductance mechanosensitive channel [Pontibacter ummariensis]|uniref:Small conductance mechanosensitive channel n=1 Tax=Pontibacter ummariensis TaxID=1610492 RepID=A0A239EX27_9BACT|nr:mechanosensitive ion channel domain-containing protein [Pontibacter ummariensis]PRY12703.1 small conductance mechanosensitive channel [Pontibacter ummariensis]SNS49216.1 small conductance mechanosensitive channel [Pontibacter ummariensis]